MTEPRKRALRSPWNMSMDDAAEYLGLPVAVLRNRHFRHDGPDHRLILEQPMFRQEDLDAWLAANTVDPHPKIRNYHAYLRKLIEAAAVEFDIAVSMITGPRRNATIALPRQVAMYIARSDPDHRLQEMGIAFDRDHTTIMHGYKKIARILSTDTPQAERIRRAIANIEFTLKGAPR